MAFSGIKPRILVSACLLGKSVRYDGEHQRQDWLAGPFRKRGIYSSVCPEVEMGLGVPRDTLRLQGAPVKMIVTRTGKDLTPLARQTSLKLLAGLPELDGCILKSRSPSCGIRRVKLYEGPALFCRKGQGIFAAELKRDQRWAALPVADEVELEDPERRISFLVQVFFSAAFRKAGNSLQSLRKLHQELRPFLLANDAVRMDGKVGKSGYRMHVLKAIRRAGRAKNLRELLPRGIRAESE